MLLFEELREFARLNPNRLTVVHCFSQEPLSNGEHGLKTNLLPTMGTQMDLRPDAHRLPGTNRLLLD